MKRHSGKSSGKRRSRTPRDDETSIDGQSRRPSNPSRLLQQSIGNRAVQQLHENGDRQARPDEPRDGTTLHHPASSPTGVTEAGLSKAVPEPRGGFNDGQAPVHAPETASKSSQPDLADSRRNRLLRGPLQHRVQPKLEVNEPDDEYEREADRVAEAVVRMPAPSAVDAPEETPTDRRQRTCTGRRARFRQAEPPGRRGRESTVRRATATRGPPTVDGDREQQVRSVLSGGRPIPGATRSYFEARMGQDFSAVRIHTGSRADDAARSIDARAFTLGEDVVFRTGTYRPDTADGKRLLAHELTHVVQQRRGAGGSPAGRDGTGTTAGPGAAVQRQRDAGTDQSTNQGEPDAGGTERERDTDGEGSESGPGEETATSEPGGEETRPDADVCSPTGYTRSEFLQQPGVSEDKEEFGLTRLDPAGVTAPEVDVKQTNGGYQVTPTTAKLPEIRSIYVKADTFREGEVPVTGGGERSCPEDRYPIQWEITPRGAEKIKAGEQEHCADFQYAFDQTLATYARAVNRVAEGDRRFESEAAAKGHLQKEVGVAPDRWESRFGTLIKRTKKRDREGYHTPDPEKRPPSYPECDHVTYRITGRSLPDVGKYPPSEIIE